MNKLGLLNNPIIHGGTVAVCIIYHSIYTDLKIFYGAICCKIISA